MSYQGIGTFRFGFYSHKQSKIIRNKSLIKPSRSDFYDLYKENIFCNNTDVSITAEEKKKYNDKCFSTSLSFGKTMLLLTILTHGRTCALLKKLIEMQGWLLLTFFICLLNQLSSFKPIIVRKNEWLLLSQTFTAKLELVFVITFENTFS